MSTRTRWKAAWAAAVGLALLGVAGCAPTGPQPTSTRTFDGYPVLDPWTQAVQRAGEDAANIVVLGDSVSEGTGVTDQMDNRWVDRLQRGLRERVGTPDCPTRSAGYHGTSSVVPAEYRADSLPDPVTRGEVTPLTDVGPGGRALQLGPGASITWQVDARSVDVGYRTRPDGGTLRVEIDGVAPTPALAIPTATRSTAPSATDAEEPIPRSTGERRVWSSEGLGRGRHTVTATNASESGSAAPVTVTDLTPYRGDRDRCVHVLDASRAGVMASFIERTPTYLADSLSLDPDLLLVPLGFNDALRGVGPAEFGRVLDSLIEQTREQGYEGPVLLVGWFVPDWRDEIPPWSQYLDQMAERTEHEGVSFVDLSAVLPPVATAPDGVYLDRLHPGPRGQVLIAESLLEALAPRSDLEGTNAPRTP
ncbi:SGNH/GDSL hydrolase family protein [Janibacter alittae]|uniref:GDSL-type esterase/lipase family protein n=1 Tax=Janibacter alittae TaxID=3115209 RepID=A0ABZ2MFI3_9MICO